MTTQAQIQIAVGQTVFSADTSTHGCREGWVATVTTVDGDQVTATITSNTHCYSCWQTGCVDNGQVDNDMVGRVVSFNVADCDESPYSDIHVRNWSIV